MNKTEFATLSSAIKTLWPRDSVIPNNEAMSLWYRNLKDIPMELAEKALDYWAQTSQFPPTVAEIRKCVVTICAGKQPDWGESWQKVLDAIRYYGYMEAASAYESFDPLTREVVKRLGWENLCFSENQMADRANFRMIFEELQGKARQHVQLTPELRSYIDDHAALPGGNDLYGKKSRAGDLRLLYQPGSIPDDPGKSGR